MSVPERYQSYAQTGRFVQPSEVELYDEADPVVWIPGAYKEMVPVRKSQLPAPVPAASARDLSPQPLFDPLAQRLAGAGIGAGVAGAGIGWGVGQAAAGIAAVGGSTAVVVMLALWLLARAGRPSVHVRQEVHNHSSWFGRNTTNL
ncbi:hypothetical protein [Streptomyces caniscabiei]|uniref:hypothetical protein n=1 Tax=Streptomyces caniscabiei TaxID=2746961 RepID=UPI001872618E|nr:hypothetical protein [Streptomyces caniscabiei]MBE4796143.1 hypothetical protein [Streptomyces caniscabiei]MDX2944448.1 hypothetical protein [Streptomyces caniscabiei]